eukprot:SAG31_NODE_2132_length_6374_cov_2.836813_1_plen_188_part_00
MGKSIASGIPALQLGTARRIERESLSVGAHRTSQRLRRSCRPPRRGRRRRPSRCSRSRSGPRLPRRSSPRRRGRPMAPPAAAAAAEPSLRHCLPRASLSLGGGIEAPRCWVGPPRTPPPPGRCPRPRARLPPLRRRAAPPPGRRAAAHRVKLPRSKLSTGCQLQPTSTCLTSPAARRRSAAAGGAVL